MSPPDRPQPAGKPPGEPPPVERYRTAAGRTMRTLEWGPQGAPVALMLHGLPGSAEDWNRLAPKLGELHVVAIDRPGYGGSGLESLPALEQVDVYAALLEELGGGPAFVIGHSYGAIPAAGIAARHPAAVGALGLLAPALREHRADREAPPGTETLKRWFAKPAVGSVVRATLLSDVGRGVLARIFDPTTFAPDPVDPEHLEGVRDRTLQWNSMRSFAREGLALKHDAALVDELLGTIQSPAAVVHAGGDRVVKPDAGRRTAGSIPRCEYHPIEGGHMLTISRADEVADLLRRLAARAGLTPGA